MHFELIYNESTALILFKVDTNPFFLQHNFISLTQTLLNDY